jgi:hypothetical protein
MMLVDKNKSINAYWQQHRCAEKPQDNAVARSGSTSIAEQWQEKD